MSYEYEGDFFEDYEDYEGDFFEDYEDYAGDFADPGGDSALRAATPTNPRDQPCPTCHTPDVLTRKDVALGYQCNACARQAERGF